MTTSVKIALGSDKKGPRDFIDAWHAAEAGEEHPCEDRLVFDDLETLLRTLTPARWTLLRVLRGVGSCSIRALARTLGRDYKNVHTDVRLLERLGLVTRTTEGRVTVPWETVLAELSLAA